MTESVIRWAPCTHIQGVPSLRSSAKISTQWVLQLQYSHHKGTWWINGLFSCWFLLDKFKGAFDKALSGKVRDDFRTTWEKIFGLPVFLRSAPTPELQSQLHPGPHSAWSLWSTLSSSCCVFFIIVWICTFWIRFSKLLFTKNNLFKKFHPSEDKIQF